jgi:hypothetical protein
MAIWNTPLYRRWYNMKSRCLNPKNEKWNNYGGRGITVSERWLVFENFFEDMGEPPSPLHTIGRIDNDGPYSQDNCRWETPIQQSNNRRGNVTIDGKTLAQIARELGITPEAVAYRLKKEHNPFDEQKYRKKNFQCMVLQKVLDGSVVRQHSSLSEASKHFPKPVAALKGIWRVLEKQRKTYAGYYWEYV